MTLLSRILGFVRDMVIASHFGASGSTDAFFVAFKIPNFLRRLFAEGAFSQAFVPVLSNYRETRSWDDLQGFMGRITGDLALILSVLTALGMVLAPLLMFVFAPGFREHPEQYGLGVELLRTTFPYLFFICLTALSAGLLNTWNHFAVPAFTPVLLNLAMITAAVWWAPLLDEPIMALAWGVLLAGLLQLGLQIPVLARMGLLSRPRVDFADVGVRQVLKLMAPAVLGASVGQLNLLINTWLASFLITGSISWLYYSDRLLEFPLGIFGAGFATVILPHLSKTHARRHQDEFNRSLDWALRWMALIGAPAALALIVLAEPLMFTLFQHDQFSGHDARMAARSLMAYAIGLPGFLGIKVLAPAFSARHDLATPARLGIHAVAVNLACSLLLVLFLAPSGWEHAGLALAVSLSALYNAGMLLMKLIRTGVYRPLAGARGFYGRILQAVMAMTALLMAYAAPLPWVSWGTTDRVLHLGAWVLAGGATYGLTLWAVGMRPHHLHLTLRTR